jgi:hypothetical protein
MQSQIQVLTHKAFRISKESLAYYLPKNQITKDIGGLNSNVSSVKADISKLEDRIIPLKNALVEIGVPSRGILEKASGLINQYTIATIIVFLLSIAVLIFLIVSMFNLKKELVKLKEQLQKLKEQLQKLTDS